MIKKFPSPDTNVRLVHQLERDLMAWLDTNLDLWERGKDSYFCQFTRGEFCPGCRDELLRGYLPPFKARIERLDETDGIDHVLEKISWSDAAAQALETAIETKKRNGYDLAMVS